MTPSTYKIRQTICEVGQRLYRFRMVASNDGNISYRIDDDHIIATPTGVCKGDMTPEGLVTVDIHGRVKGGGRPSSELAMHLFIYQQRPDVSAVVHAHPIYATAFATAGLAMNECVLPEIVITLGAIPLAQYGTPSTHELPESLRPYVHDHDAILLANHGAVTFGRDLWDAYFKMERLEHYAQILFLARQLGGERGLASPEVEKLREIRQKFGLSGPAPECIVADMRQQHDHDCTCGKHTHASGTDIERLIDEIYQEVKHDFWPERRSGRSN